MLQIVLLSFLVVLVGQSSFLWNRGLWKTDISYGLYLWHMFTIAIIMNSPVNGNPFALFVVLLFAISISYLSWVFIEEPSLRLSEYVYQLRTTGRSS